MEEEKKLLASSRYDAANAIALRVLKTTGALAVGWAKVPTLPNTVLCVARALARGPWAGSGNDRKLACLGTRALLVG